MAILAHFLNGTSSFLQETLTCIKTSVFQTLLLWLVLLMSSNSNQIRPLTTDLPALERLKNQFIMFLSLQFFILGFFLSMNGAYAFQKLIELFPRETTY